MKKITRKTLKEWDACADGYAGFNALFPKGADLKTATKGLTQAGHSDWADWLWYKCSESTVYFEQTVVSAGYRGTAKAGNHGIATAGHGGTATAGYMGTARAGDYGTARAGYLGTARAGDYGTARAGDYGTARAGYLGTARAGDSGTATVGDGGTAMAGYAGVILIKCAIARVSRTKVGLIGENGLKPNTAYTLDDACNFVEYKGE